MFGHRIPALLPRHLPKVFQLLAPWRLQLFVQRGAPRLQFFDLPHQLPVLSLQQLHLLHPIFIPGLEGLEVLLVHIVLLLQSAVLIFQLLLFRFLGSLRGGIMPLRREVTLLPPALLGIDGRVGTGVPSGHNIELIKRSDMTPDLLRQR